MGSVSSQTTHFVQEAFGGATTDCESDSKAAAFCCFNNDAAAAAADVDIEDEEAATVAFVEEATELLPPPAAVIIDDDEGARKEFGIMFMFVCACVLFLLLRLRNQMVDDEQCIWRVAGKRWGKKGNGGDRVELNPHHIHIHTPFHHHRLFGLHKNIQRLLLMVVVLQSNKKEYEDQCTSRARTRHSITAECFCCC